MFKTCEDIGDFSKWRPVGQVGPLKKGKLDHWSNLPRQLIYWYNIYYSFQNYMKCNTRGSLYNTNNLILLYMMFYFIDKFQAALSIW